MHSCQFHLDNGVGPLCSAADDLMPGQFEFPFQRPLDCRYVATVGHQNHFVDVSQLSALRLWAIVLHDDGKLHGL